MRHIAIIFLLFTLAAHSADRPALTAIYDVQGAGGTSPLNGQDVTVEGVVTGDFQEGDADTARNLGGFYIQSVPDADFATSDGVFIFDGNNPASDVDVGDAVRVTGTVNEYFGETQINASAVSVLGTGRIQAVPLHLPVAATTTNSDGELIANLERYEGMLITFPQTLTVSDPRGLGRFGEVGLSQSEPPYQIADSVAKKAANTEFCAVYSIMLDDGKESENMATNRYLDSSNSLGHSIRAGDTITGVTGNLRYSRGSGSNGSEVWRLMPSVDPQFDSVGPSPGSLSDSKVRCLMPSVYPRFDSVSPSPGSPSGGGRTGLDRVLFEGLGGAVVGLVLGLLGGAVWLIVWATRKAKKAAAPKVQAIAAKSKAAISDIGKTKEDKILEIADEFFALASDEISQGRQQPGLWAKSLALADGDPRKQKANYIRLRAGELSESGASE